MAELADLRAAEHGKYHRAYGLAPNYKMGERRKADAINDLRALPGRGSYLDVSCGRGEMLTAALAMGFEPVQGTEIVPELIDGSRVIFSEAHALQVADKSFDVASLWDVIEHLVRGDDEAVCHELERVARRHVLLTANNRPSKNQAGEDLHINRRPYEEWDALFRRWFSGRVTWIKGTPRQPRNYVSEAWRIDF
jgi:ubiquinone/menaquinone biosynthesis C-methylase UbiE